ncbi:type I secretion system permease/ATPase [Devosia psychrophila]|nr:type I secretion system permease/ATPase [Devosia psychrophila]KKC33963.1 hypothetical protein WH91_05740 [Devosia psychrophila]
MDKADTFAAALGIYRRIIVVTLIFSAAINILLFVGPLYMLQVYDRVLQSRNETTLVLLTVIAVAMLIMHALLEFLRSRVLVRTGYQLDEALSGPLFSRVVKLSLANPGGGSQAALGDVARLRDFLTGNGLTAMCDVPWVPMFLFVCFMFHPLIGLVALVGASVVLALAFLTEVATKKSLDNAQNANQAAQQFASTTLQNAEVIRALGMEQPLRNRWLGKHGLMMSLQATASDRAGVIASISKFVRAALQIAILGVGAYLALEGEITAGLMIAASIMMGRALSPVDQLVGNWKSFVGARQAYGRLKAVFAQVPADMERTDLPRPLGQIDVEQLATVIPGTRTPVLQGISFTIKPGEAVAIFGPSGAGKSSLVRTLVGVWATAQGSVRLDGSEIGHWNAEKLGQHIGYLPQDVELFAGTIAENIGRFQNAGSAEVLSAAMRAGVHEMIQKLPQGYETQIGVGGRQLSGGQRQRVGLARALFNNPAIVVLDEPNANLDSDGETALMQVLANLKKEGTTVIFVSHKMNLVNLSDKTIILREGRLQRMVPTREIVRPAVTVNSAARVVAVSASSQLSA